MILSDNLTIMQMDHHLERKREKIKMKFPKFKLCCIKDIDKGIEFSPTICVISGCILAVYRKNKAKYQNSDFRCMRMPNNESRIQWMLPLILKQS